MEVEAKVYSNIEKITLYVTYCWLCFLIRQDVHQGEVWGEQSCLKMVMGISKFHFYWQKYMWYLECIWIGSTVRKGARYVQIGDCTGVKGLQVDVIRQFRALVLPVRISPVWDSDSAQLRTAALALLISLLRVLLDRHVSISQTDLWLRAYANSAVHSLPPPVLGSGQTFVSEIEQQLLGQSQWTSSLWKGSRDCLKLKGKSMCYV